MKHIIAVFGGSFNPPTIAHVDLAKQILAKNKDIEKVIFVPVSTKYNKKGLASDLDRFNMLKCICDNEKNLEVSSIELDSERQLYTIETLRTIHQQYPNKNIFFVLGTDNLKELQTWHNADKLLEEFKMLVLERDNDVMEKIIENNNILKQHKEAFIKLEKIQRINLSSSYVRNQIRLGKPVSKLLPKCLLSKENMLKNIYKSN